MSLLIEQCLDDNSIVKNELQIYTTGAKLVPLEISINNKKRYVWVVNEFRDDSFDTNGEICYPTEYGIEKNDLIR